MFREEAEREMSEAQRLPSMEAKLMDGDWHVTPAIEEDPEMRCLFAIPLESHLVDGVVTVNDATENVKTIDKGSIDPCDVS